MNFDMFIWNERISHTWNALEENQNSERSNMLAKLRKHIEGSRPLPAATMGVLYTVYKVAIIGGDQY